MAGIIRWIAIHASSIDDLIRFYPSRTKKINYRYVTLRAYVVVNGNSSYFSVIKEVSSLVL